MRINTYCYDPLRVRKKPLATTTLEQESESSNIVFLVPDDVLRTPWHTGYGGGGEKVYAEKTECSKI